VPRRLRGRPQRPVRRAEDRRSRSSHAAQARPASGRVPAIGGPNAARPCLPTADCADAGRLHRPPTGANSCARGILAARVRRLRNAGTRIAGSPPAPHRPGCGSRSRGHAAFRRSAGMGLVGSPPGPPAAQRAARGPRRRRRSPCHPSRSTDNPARSTLAPAVGMGRGVVPLDLLFVSHLTLSTRPRRFPNPRCRHRLPPEISVSCLAQVSKSVPAMPAPALRASVCLITALFAGTPSTLSS
jgi:hypothetical protein